MPIFKWLFLKNLCSHSNLVSTDVVYYQLAGLEDFESRARLREEIRRKVARIDVTFGVEIIVAGDSEVGGVRPGTGRTMVRVRFVNGVERVLFLKRRTLFYFGLVKPRRFAQRLPAKL